MTHELVGGICMSFNLRCVDSCLTTPFLTFAITKKEQKNFVVQSINCSKAKALILFDLCIQKDELYFPLKAGEKENQTQN